MGGLKEVIRWQTCKASTILKRAKRTSLNALACYLAGCGDGLPLAGGEERENPFEKRMMLERAGDVGEERDGNFSGANRGGGG